MAAGVQSTRYHAIMGGASLAIVLGALAIGVVFLRSGADDGKRSVPSLRDNWARLEGAALAWHEDAVLTDVVFDIKGYTAYQVRAEYHSSYEPDTILFVGIDQYGELDLIPLDFPVPSSSAATNAPGILAVTGAAQEPILPEDWRIDSQQALDTFSKDERVLDCLVTPKALIEMSLSRDVTRKPAWSLKLINCPAGENLGTYYLDAQTGEPFDPYGS